MTEPIPDPARDLIVGWRRQQRRKGLSENANRKRAGTISLLARWLDGASLLEATTDQLEDFLDSRGCGVQGRVWNISNLTCFYAWCVETGVLTVSPAVRLARPRLPRLLPRPWSEESFAKAVANAKPRMRAWLMLAGYAGLRCKEIAALRREHVLDDMDPPMLLVADGKGGHQRRVPIHADLLAALRANGMPAEGWLWPQTRGVREGLPVRPKSSETVSVTINNYLRKQGIRATAHMGRHRFATSVYRESQDLRLTQELMGHSSPMTTAIYASWDSAKAAGVVAGIGAAGITALPAVPLLPALVRPPSLAAVLETGATIDDIAEAVSEQESGLDDFADLAFFTYHPAEEAGAFLRKPVDVWLKDRNLAAILYDFRTPTQRDANRYSWAADCFEDGETAARLWLMLPEKVRTKVAAEVEQLRADLARPYPVLEVETLTEPAECGNCGGEITGRAAKVEEERWRYCAPCLRSAADAVSA